MLVDFSDFKAEAKIPGLFPVMGTEDLVNAATQYELNEFIEKYEMEYLLQFFGDKRLIRKLHKYNDLPKSEKQDKGMNELIQSLKSIIPLFIAFHWFRNETVQNTGIGAVIPQGENSKRTNNVVRSVHIWNEMAEESCKLYARTPHFYRNPFIHRIDIFNKTNSYGI
jgi:hypothetical protein